MIRQYSYVTPGQNRNRLIPEKNFSRQFIEKDTIMYHNGYSMQERRIHQQVEGVLQWKLRPLTRGFTLTDDLYYRVMAEAANIMEEQRRRGHIVGYNFQWLPMGYLGVTLQVHTWSLTCSSMIDMGTSGLATTQIFPGFVAHGGTL